MEAITLTLEQQDRNYLGRCTLLRGVPEDGIARVLDEPGAELVHFSGGQVVYSPQHFSRRLGILLSGSLQVTKGELTVSCLEPGELFGAAALYCDAPQYATTITARRPSRCLMLDQALIDRLLEQHSQIRENYLRYLTGRIRFLSNRLQSLAQAGAEGKLARYLLANGQGGSVTCTASGLAQRLGISRASLYRAFEALENSALIVRRGKTILIPDLAALESVL